MESGQVFEKYYARLAREGKIKALILALIVAFSLSMIPAIVSLFINYNAIWISLGAGVVGLLLHPLFYRLFFMPTSKQIAWRIDRLGLEERLVTMLELEKDESYIAMRQREDARKKLDSLNSQLLRFSFLKTPIIVCIVLCVCAVSLITLSAVSVELPIGWKAPIESIPIENYSYVRVKYFGSDGGSVKENDEQSVIYDTDAQTVVAIADIGYIFVRWSDGINTAVRTDRKVKQEISVVAIFERYQEPPPPPPNDPSDNTNDNVAYEERNKIKNGEIYYRDIYEEEFYNPAMEDLATDGEKSQDMRDVIEMYLDTLL